MMTHVERAGGEGNSRVTVYGHRAVLAALRRELDAERVGQAYLLLGPPGVGRRTVARWLAQGLLCEAAQAVSRPCGECRTCSLVGRDSLVDLHTVEPPLRVDAVREITRALALAPAEARHRVAIVPELDRASIAASNALLKTLEEPSQHAVILLTAGDTDTVLPTVRSRCRGITLRPLPVATVADALETGWQVDAESSASLARRSAGRLGWAVETIEDPDVGTLRSEWLDGLEQVLAANMAERLGKADGLVKTGEVAAGLTVWRNWWRDVLLLTYGLDESVVNCDRIDGLRAAARRFGAASSVQALRALGDASRRLDANTNPQLTLEVLMLEMPS